MGFREIAARTVVGMAATPTSTLLLGIAGSVGATMVASDLVKQHVFGEEQKTSRIGMALMGAAMLGSTFAARGTMGHVAANMGVSAVLGAGLSLAVGALSDRPAGKQGGEIVLTPKAETPRSEAPEVRTDERPRRHPGTGGDAPAETDGHPGSLGEGGFYDVPIPGWTGDPGFVIPEPEGGWGRDPGIVVEGIDGSEIDPGFIARPPAPLADANGVEV